MRTMVTEIGLSEAVSVKWRKGGNPSAKNLKAIADYFGTTPKALLAAVESNSMVILGGTTPETNDRLSKLEKDIEWFKEVVASQQETIHNMSETIHNMSSDSKKTVGNRKAVDSSMAYNLK